MNDEILELVEGLEVIANVLIKDGQTHKQIDLKTLVKLCKYIKKINNLQPVAWMYPVFHDDKMQFTADAITSENIDIHFQSHGSSFKVTPLYKLD
ncbi:TPA: hypothetical protein ACXJQF_002917 [Proteus mirabilis]